MMFHVGNGVNWNGIGRGDARNSLNFSLISIAIVAMLLFSSLIRSESSGVIAWGWSASVTWLASISIALAEEGLLVVRDSVARCICSTAVVMRVRSVASSVLIVCSSAA